MADRPGRATSQQAAASIDGVDVAVFIAELALLAALAVAGARLGSHVSAIVLAVSLPVAAAVLWGRILAPRARHRLSHPSRLFAKLALTLTASALLVAADATTPGIVLLATAGPIITVAELRRRT